MWYSKLETKEWFHEKIYSNSIDVYIDFKVNGVNNCNATKSGVIAIEVSSTNASEYRARDRDGEWSDWTTSNIIYIHLLSKGIRTIEIQARSGNGGDGVANHTMVVFSL